MSIILFSGPVHSGKTSALVKWCAQQNNTCGILMPDINGSRKIMDIKTKEIFDIECSDPGNTNELLTPVGKFHFYTAAFEKANSILINSLYHDPDWLIIDEAGKLELDSKGLSDALKKTTAVYNNKKGNGNLLIVVRDSLIEAVISFFKIEDYRLIHQLEELI